MMPLIFVPPNYDFSETPVGLAVYCAFDKAGNFVGEYTLEQAKQEVEEGGGWFAEQLSDLAGWIASLDYEALGTAIGSGVAAGIQAGQGFLGGAVKEVIPALIEGVEDGYDYIRTKISGQESNAIAAITVGFLVILSAIFVYHKVITVATTKEWRGIGSGYLSLDPND